jgi:hypothetical protein
MDARRMMRVPFSPDHFQRFAEKVAEIHPTSAQND